MISLVESTQNQAQWQSIQRMVDNLLRPTRTQLQPVQSAIRDGFADNFDAESAGGRPWAQLATSTVKDRIRRGYPGEHPILNRDGDYRSTFADGGNSDHISEIDYQLGLTSVSEGSGSNMVAWHELGNDNLPARPVLILSSGATGNVGDAIREMIGGILNGG